MSRDEIPGPPLWLDLAVIAFTLGPVLYIAYLYPNFPDRIPIHWNARGEPDGWAARSWISVFFPGMVAASMQSFLWLLTHDLHWQIAEDATSKIAAAGARADMFRANLRMMQPLRLVLAVMMGTIVVNLPLTVLGYSRPEWFLAIVLASLAVLLGVVVWGVRVAWKAQRKWEQAASSREMPEFDSRHWRLLGAFYHNPDDPTLFVHKRIGMGVTLNMAHPRVKRYAVSLAVAIGLMVTLMAGIRGTGQNP